MADITYSRYEKDGELMQLTARREIKTLGGSGYIAMPKDSIGGRALVIFAKNKSELPKVMEVLKEKLKEELKPSEKGGASMVMDEWEESI